MFKEFTVLSKSCSSILQYNVCGGKIGENTLNGLYLTVMCYINVNIGQSESVREVSNNKK